MSVTSGFFNSLNHDRRYNAQQFAALFDGIINDGVFANIGVAFAITAGTGVTITIGAGRAWFNSTWVHNDALLPLTFEASEVVLDRIDAIVIEVDHSEAVRRGDIKIVKGVPSSSPKRPTMADTATKHQHPLAYIYRKAGSTVITQADVTNMVGTSSCPYITGILQVQNIDNIVAQWEGQWNRWYTEKVSETNSDSSELLAEMKSDFDIWFADVKALLDDDTATALAGKVAELQGKFDDLAREGAVYDTLEDSDLDVILGSDGTAIRGKTVLGGNDLSGYVTKDKLSEVAGTKLNRSEKFVRNLLDNSDFRNPVNQRGLNSYECADKRIHTIDRWSLSSEGASVTVKTDYVSKSATMAQLIAGLDKSKKYTAAVCFIDGTISSYCGTIADGIASWYDNIYVYSGQDDLSIFAIPARSPSGIRWAALYEGEYTAETLPEYRPKGYAAELTECMRYYQKFGALQIPATPYSATSILVTPPCKIEMRAYPTLSDIDMSHLRCGGKTLSSFPSYTVAAFGGSPDSPNFTITFASEHGLPLANAGFLYMSGELSADL